MRTRRQGKVSQLLLVAIALALVASACANSDASGSDEAQAEEGTHTDDGGVGGTSSPTITVAEVPDAETETPTAFVDLTLEEKIEVFLGQPNSSLASNIAADMALDGDPRWGPWLLDLLRLGPSNTTDEQVAGAMSIISGIPREPDQAINEDYRTYGQWVYDEAIDPGPGYREWKKALYGPIDEDFPALLDSIRDDLTLSRVQWGGVGRGGIPELNQPARVSAAEADWMVDDEVVFGAVVDGVAVAYPFRILGHHELANDIIGDTPVALVFCTLCRTALLLGRQVEGQILDFQTSGMLINSNKIMVDIQTDTLWSHLEAVGLGGTHVGVDLGQFPLETTTWGDWVEAHPDTEVLDIPDVIFSDNPEQPPIVYDYEPGAAYRFYYDDPDVWFPILDTPTDDIALKEAVVGLDLNGEHLAVTVDGIVASGPRVFEVGGQAILLVPTGSAGARAYDASGTSLADGDAPSVVTADESTAILDDGSEVARMIVDQGLWFAWFGNHPETDWWPRS